MEKTKRGKDISEHVGALAGNAMSQNVQAGTNVAMDSMGELLFKAGRISDVGFEQSKGNLFEFIEAAKLQTNMANKGHFLDKNPVTDIPTSRGGLGEHTAPDDFRLVKDGKVVGRGQAKYNNNAQKAANNFVDPKYHNMQRVAPSDQIPEIREKLDEMMRKGQISKHAYDNAVKNLQQDGLTDPTTGISSGGTTRAEIQKLKGKDGKVSEEAVKRYAMKFETKQLVKEVTTTATNMAATSAITNGIVSGVRNMFAVFKDQKELAQAIKDVGADMGRGAVRGASTGSLSSLIRYSGTKLNVPVLSDSTAATVMAGGIIDGGVAIYAYAKGEITAEQLGHELVDTTVKSAATIYFTKAVTAVVGTANPFLPMAIYTAASYVVTCTRSIINEAKLNAAEYEKMTLLLKESTELMKQYHEQLNSYMKHYKENQRNILQGFLDSFGYYSETGQDYERAIYSIVNFANQTGIALQYADFNEFSSAMRAKREFVLK